MSKTKKKKFFLQGGSEAVFLEFYQFCETLKLFFTFFKDRFNDKTPSIHLFFEKNRRILRINVTFRTDVKWTIRTYTTRRSV